MTAAALDIRVLGPLEVLAAGEPVPIGGPKPRAVLATLALHHGKSVSVDRLIDAIWGAEPPRTAAKTLQKYVSDLRKALSDVIATTHQGYMLDVPCASIDACRLDEAVERASDLAADRIVAELQPALEAWRGDPFPELDDSIDAHAERTRLLERRLEAEEALVGARLELGHHGAVVGRVEELLSAHPFRESLWSLLMLALYRSGRQAEALRAYRRLFDELGDVGLEPTQSLRSLEQQILLQDPELEHAAPALANTNLPDRLTSFVGRTQELASLSELSARSRIVTLLGAGGSGKTRLAIAAARQQLGSRPDGVWFIDLAPLTSPDEIPKAVADPLGVRAQGGRDVLDVLIDVVADRSMLLVMDNCEHLVAGAADVVARLATSARGIDVLATSREPLGVEGEVTYDVPTLPVPEVGAHGAIEDADAVILFVDRARQLAPDYVLNDANGSAIADICRKLDGIPLAIELAAAQTRTYTAGEIDSLLDDRFRLLTSPVRTDGRRHHTLQAAVDWSYNSLDDEERTLFDRLSVFRGSFDRAAVERICASAPLTPNDIVRLLPRLVDRSLVVVDHSGSDSRYRLLETLRIYAWDRIDAADQSALRDAHASHYCEIAEQAAPLLRTATQDELLARLSLDYGNLRRALRWAYSHNKEMGVRLTIALAILWDAVGPRNEAQDWAQRSVELADGELRHLYVAARVVASDLFMSTHLSHSTRFAEEAIDEARTIGDRRGEAAGLRALGWARALGDDFAAAIELGEQALDIWRSIGDVWETSWSLERLGESDYLNPERAVERLEEALAGFRVAGDHRRAAMVMYKIAEAAVRSGGDLEQPERYVDTSLEVFERMGSVHDSAHALLELGRIRRRRGDAAGAREALESGLERMRLVGDQRCETRTLAALGIALIDDGEEALAWDRLLETMRLADEIDERQMARVALAGLGRISGSKGRFRHATVLTAAADRIATDLGLPTTDRSSHSRTERLDDWQSKLGPAAFDAAWRKGTELPTSAAIQQALATSFPGD